MKTSEKQSILVFHEKYMGLDDVLGTYSKMTKTSDLEKALAISRKDLKAIIMYELPLREGKSKYRGASYLVAAHARKYISGCDGDSGYMRSSYTLFNAEPDRIAYTLEEAAKGEDVHRVYAGMQVNITPEMRWASTLEGRL